MSLPRHKNGILSPTSAAVTPRPPAAAPAAGAGSARVHTLCAPASILVASGYAVCHGLVTFYVLAVMHLKTRRVHMARITPSPNATWMKQACRNLTDCEDGFLKDASHLIVDRDTSFIAMRKFLEQNTETEVILMPPKSPNLNAYMERWFRSLKSECLDRMIVFGRKSLEKAVEEYVEHYHIELNHQGLGNEFIEPDHHAGSVVGRIPCRERLGGMLKYYHRRAA